MPNRNFGEIHLTQFVLFRPANRTSPACSIQFSFFLSAWFLDEKTVSSRETIVFKTKPHCQRSGYAGTKKSIGLSDPDITASSNKVAINQRVSHVPGASPRRGKLYKISKKRQRFFIGFFGIFCETTINHWKSMVSP
jgi:hypothetical protein